MKYSAIIAQLAVDLSNSETEIAELKEDLEYEHSESARLRNELLLLKEQLTSAKAQLSELKASVKKETVETDPAARATAYMVKTGHALWNGKRIGLVKEVMGITGWRLEAAMNWLASFMDAYQHANAEAVSIPVLLEEPAPVTQRSHERLTA